jgi:hypothetical protein
MHQKARKGIAVAGIALGALGIAAPSASATASAQPTGCHYEASGTSGAAALCDESNGGEYRAIAMCRYSDGTLQHVEGPWQQTGWSYVYCQGDSEVFATGIETRA